MFLMNKWWASAIARRTVFKFNPIKSPSNLEDFLTRKIWQKKEKYNWYQRSLRICQQSSRSYDYKLESNWNRSCRNKKYLRAMEWRTPWETEKERGILINVFEDKHSELYLSLIKPKTLPIGFFTNIVANFYYLHQLVVNLECVLIKNQFPLLCQSRQMSVNKKKLIPTQVERTIISLARKRRTCYFSGSEILQYYEF